jgi:hypothetical protein
VCFTQYVLMNFAGNTLCVFFLSTGNKDDYWQYLHSHGLSYVRDTAHSLYMCPHTTIYSGGSLRRLRAPPVYIVVWGHIYRRKKNASCVPYMHGRYLVVAANFSFFSWKKKKNGRPALTFCRCLCAKRCFLFCETWLLYHTRLEWAWRERMTSYARQPSEGWCLYSHIYSYIT